MSSISKQNRASASPSRQYNLRPSVDSPVLYEVVSQDSIINDLQLSTSINSKSVPSVKMQRLNTHLPPTSTSTSAGAIENGLAPMELALISGSSANMASSTMMISAQADDDDDVLEEAELSIIEKEEGEGEMEVEEDMQELLEESLLVESVSTGNDEEETNKVDTSIVSINSATSSASNVVYEIIAPSKMNREMRNLQQSTNDSKVLSDFLSVSDTPRHRNRRTKETSSSNEHDSNDTSMLSTLKVTDKEIPLKDSGNDSDSTVVMNDEIGKRRRKSVSRSRSRTATRSKSVSSRSRKSEHQADEIEDNLEMDEEVEDDNIGEAPYIAKLIDNRAPSAPPKPGWDSYCFKCHTDTAVLSLTCRKCKCSYHRHCARLLSTPIPKNPDDFVCIDCIEIDKAKQSSVNKYNHPKIEPYMLKEMLITILEKIRTYPDRDFFENDIQFKSSAKENNQPLIITQMSLKRIEERIVGIYYTVSEAFLHDIKQLEHNWSIVDRNKLKSLKLILKFVNTEINEMEACVHCFSNSFVVSNWFTAPCKRPHLLIWAKLKGYPYWPAKVMSLDSTKENADVRFFGAHDRAWVPVSHCLIFSDKDPNKAGKTSTPTSNKSKSQKGIADAIKEKEEYIQNMKERYGFRYAFTREILDPDNLQLQLEIQLPGLQKESSSNAITEKSDVDKNQKEKLTLKIVKASDGTQTIEKTPKVNDKDRHPLYRVLSRNEENSENQDQSRVVKAIILKRNTEVVDKETKGRSRNASLSETSESNISCVSNSSQRRKSALREPAKRRKSVRKETRSVTPEPAKKKQRSDENSSGGNVLTALSLQPRKSRQKSTDSLHAPIIVSASKSNVPAGTSAIYQLNEVPSASRTIHRSQSFNRTHDKGKKDKTRRLSTLSTPSTLSHDKIVPLKSLTPQKSASAAATTRKSVSGRSTPVSIVSNVNSSKRPSTSEDFNREIVIKSELMSEDEEVVERTQVTLSDLSDLVNDKNDPAKRKTILISTSDNSNDSFQHQVSRARKSFPKPMTIGHVADSHRESQMSSSTSAMVLIPQVFPTAPSDSSSLPSSSTIQSQLNTSNQTSATTRRLSTAKNQAQAHTIPIMNGNDQNSNASSSVDVNVSGNRPDTVLQNRSIRNSSAVPPLIPKPSGVFTSEGNTFQRDTGEVAALFSQNAHRMTDYFKSLLVDTIGAISNGVSDAQNVILKLENEKLKQQIANLKADNLQKLERLRKEHTTEQNAMKFSYEEKIKSIHNAHSEDKVHLIKEIRQQCEIEKQRAIETTRRETKKMTWCSNCTKEARFYCCWNTSYCGPPCQKSHWQQHMKYCTNRNSNNTTPDSNASNIKQQQQQHLLLQQQQQQQIETLAPNSAPSAAVSLANLATNNNRQIIQQITLPKQPQLHSPIIQQQSSSQLNASLSHLENTLLRNNSKPQTIITTTRGQQIIQTLLPSYTPQQFLIQQQKLSTATIKSPLPVPMIVSTDQSTGPANLIVRTVPRNNSPQMTVISTTSSPNISDIIASQHTMVPVSVPSTTPTSNTSSSGILNHSVIASNNGKTFSGSVNLNNN